jgi:Fe-S oxidoreductase
MGPLYQPPQIKGEFDYPKDGSFTRAMTRCVGVGACRRHDSSKGIMCPSYMATREERYSTRGRARLLFEMLHGDPIENLWRSEAVEEALDLCLACKGCKSDCPVHVDMATYKAEFRFHHYKGRLRPRAAYAMGLINEWSRLASLAPSLANAMLQTPGVSALAKWIGGVAPQRQMPSYATECFTQWFRRTERQRSDRRVLLWPDTFNNYFRPQTAIAATRVLEGLGFNVAIPDRPLCCGRPLYDWGMLDRARRRWHEILDALAPEINRATPIIGLEPACVSAFLDELVALFPNDDRAQRLAKQTRFITEFIDEAASDHSLPQVKGSALVQAHCHHHAVLDFASERNVLDRTGVDYSVLQSGCCGMAGSFGFERAKYDVSQAAAERVLLPAIRQAPANAMIIANGFSCREQIEQATGHSTVHVAELLAGRDSNTN